MIFPVAPFLMVPGPVYLLSYWQFYAIIPRNYKYKLKAKGSGILFKQYFVLCTNTIGFMSKTSCIIYLFFVCDV